MAERVENVNVVDEMKQAYGDYALAVIVGRAIPDLYDGLKPVTRRVLTAMKWLNLKPDAKFMKAARVDGETTGKLHPHGGAYGAMVTASQWWTNNHTLVDGHGNWGSPTDGPAAPRYTEARLTNYAYSVLLDDTDTWETRDSYDGSFKEPIRLNAKLPNVLLNGGEGIAVGMATRIPTHNLRSVAKALRFIAQEDYKNANKQLVPDFPTGCEVVKDEGLLAYLNTGRGSIRMRAVCERGETSYGKKSKRAVLTFTNLPLHANTEQIGEQIKDQLGKGKITTVADVRDETDRTGIRLVVVLKSGIDVDTAEKELYRWTSLDTKFSTCNMVIDGVRPVELTSLEILSRWMKWRDSRLVVSLKSELEVRRSRLEVVKGLITAMDLIDDLIADIKSSPDRAGARQKLLKRKFTELQANAILDMRLAQLTKLDDKSMRSEAKTLQARIKEIIKLNSKEDLRTELILDEIDEIAIRHGNTRKSKVIDVPAELDVQIIKQGRKNLTVNAASKPRFVQVDEKKGILTQQKKLLRSSWLVASDEKMIFLCDNGKFKKLNANAKGPLFDAPTKVLFKAKTGSLPTNPLSAVYELDDAYYANLLTWDALQRCTSRGKNFIPDGAKLIHLGLDPYTIKMPGRKKDKVVSLNTIKARSIGGKGQKIVNVISASPL